MSKIDERELILREAKKIVEGLGKTLSPICEVVLHDLRDASQSIVLIENNLSGRDVGDASTELGLARINDPDFPEVITNYKNQFPDGRAVKSTSIGLKDSEGNYFAAICLNMDISYMNSIKSYLELLTRTDDNDVPNETLTTNTLTIEERVLEFANQLNKSPLGLTSAEKRSLVQTLDKEGVFNQRGAAETVAGMIGSSRSNVYYYLKK